MTATGAGEAFNEEAFQLLLSSERKRSQRSHQPFLLLLLQLESESAQPVRMETAVSDRLFEVLSTTLRDTDFIGWYREPQVIGAVLTHLGDGTPEEVSDRMSRRIAEALRKVLPDDVARLLTLQAYPQPESSRS